MSRRTSIAGPRSTGTSSRPMRIIRNLWRNTSLIGLLIGWSLIRYDLRKAFHPLAEAWRLHQLAEAWSFNRNTLGSRWIFSILRLPHHFDSRCPNSEVIFRRSSHDDVPDIRIGWICSIFPIKNGIVALRRFLKVKNSSSCVKSVLVCSRRRNSPIELVGTTTRGKYRTN